MMDFKKVNPKKILVINTFGIGDVLFTMPFVKNIRTHFPEARISYLANRRAAPLIEGDKSIDQVFIYERDEYVRLSKKSKIEFLKKSYAFLKEMKNQQFDVVFDFSLNSTIGLLTWYAGIPHRIDY